MATSHSKPCFCHDMHRFCDRTTCAEAAKGGKSAGGQLGQLANNGCETCRMLYHALHLSEIAAIWRQAKGTGCNDESKLNIECYCVNEHNMIRTVGSENGADWRHFVFFLDPETVSNTPIRKGCCALRKPNQKPVEYTGSDEAFRCLNRWIRTCNETHHCYVYQSVQPSLPARVLDISSDTIRLVETAQQNSHYTTLSHCWGNGNPLCLTKARKTHLMNEGAPFSALPKTYQDSIMITRRLDMDIRYIWIDSLCIIQDDNADWEEHAAEMQSVYGSSYLNICANAARDDKAGCFAHVLASAVPRAYKVPASNVMVREAQRMTHHDYGVNYRSFEPRGKPPAPLLKRAWVLQERLLAPRVVYYDGAELLWECKGMHDCQCGAITVLAGFKNYWAQIPQPQDRKAREGKYEHPVCVWMRIVEKYCAMKLTYDKDRLMALEGVAKQLGATELAGDYFSGMWRRDLAKQIPWTLTDTYERPEVVLAPTWSWASTKGEVSFHDRCDIHLTASRIEASILDVTPSSQSTAAGREIVLTVRLKAITAMAEVVEAPSNRPANLRAQLGGVVAEFRSDLITSAETVGTKIEVLFTWWACMANAHVVFLVLKRACNEEQLYERYGLLDLDFSIQAKKKDIKRTNGTIAVFRKEPERTISII